MSFADINKQFADDFIKNSQKTIKDTAIALFTDIIDDSPIDTGNFISNYSIDDAPYIEGTSSKSSKSAEITTAILRLSDDVEEIALTNPTPYGEYLEFGSSDQNPQGMIRLNSDRFDSIMDKEARNNGIR